MTSNKHMNGYFLEQEALRGVGIPKFLMCPGFALSSTLSFFKFKYPHSVEILKLLNLDFCPVFLMLLFPVPPKKQLLLKPQTQCPRHLDQPLGAGK